MLFTVFSFNLFLFSLSIFFVTFFLFPLRDVNNGERSRDSVDDVFPLFSESSPNLTPFKDHNGESFFGRTLLTVKKVKVVP